MRSGGDPNRFNDDDDFFSDGLCPSCRLAINKETGRLKCVVFSSFFANFLRPKISSALFSREQVFLSQREFFFFFAKCRWCTSGSEAWRFRVKLMLLIPAVLLPITITFIALSRSQSASKASDSRAFPSGSSSYGTRKQDERKEIESDIFWRKFPFGLKRKL